MKLLLILFAAFVFVPSFVQAQTKLPRTYLFRKEASKHGRFYHIEPAETTGTKTFQALAASVMPGLKSGGLIFISAQKERVLSAETAKTWLITYDSKQLKDLEFESVGEPEADDSIIKVEGAAISVSLNDLMEIIKAESITAQFGAFVYRLGKDNIAALHYLAEQIEKDSKSAGKRKSRAKAIKRKAR